jgi:hypothetical protein
VVYDPAGKNPVYNVDVYIPNSPVMPLPHGASCAGCDSLFPSSVVASAVTDALGHFQIQNAPMGQNLPLVVQIGKWRKQYTVNVTGCQDNIPSGKLSLPKNHNDGPNASLPDIAVSTGNADTLECLLMRMGVDKSEYVSGASTSGRIHVFYGNGATMQGGNTPFSYQGLWDSAADLTLNDIVLLSCEGQPTGNVTDASRKALWDYANGGGRVFASHYHWKWLTDSTPSGPFATATPAIANWYPTTLQTSAALDDNRSFPGDVITTLQNGMPFPEGVALQKWLGNVGALTNNQLQVWYARDNEKVTMANVNTQPWINFDQSVSAMPNGGTAAAGGDNEYLSFDMPLGGSKAEPCGRVVYSDLHVSGGPASQIGTAPPGYPGNPLDYETLPIVPDNCAARDLTPQEKALEFMIFDLSSCLIPPGQMPAPSPVR